MKIINITLLTAILISAYSGAVFARQTEMALDLARQYQSTDIDPILGDDGRILFTFGMSEPRVVCAPLKICDIALEPNEIVNSVKVGDQARWIIDGAVVGGGEDRREHILIKPKAAGLENTLFVATNKRAYSITLISHGIDHMGKVGFTYGGSTTLNSIQTSSELNTVYQGTTPTRSAPAEEAVISDRDILGSNLNFGYRISGAKESWTPVRVYDDGIKTYIDFDAQKIIGRELPALLIFDTNALGSIVNYRVQRGRYIVDGLFDQAGLVLGVGKKQSRVTIRRVTQVTAQDQPYRN